MASPVLTKTQPTMTGGQLSRRLLNRIDIEQYQSGLSIVQNAVVWPHGGLARTGGTRFVAAIQDETKKPRLIPFEFNDQQAFVLEVNEGAIRFYVNNGLMIDDKTITNGTFATDITGWTDISAGTGSIAWNTDHMDLVGVGGGNEARAEQTLVLGTATYTITATTSAELNWKAGTTSGGSEISSGTVDGAADTFSFTPANQGTVYITFENPNSDTRELDDVSIDTPVYQIENPWVEADLPEIHYAQSADILYLAIPGKQNKTIQRTSNTTNASFTITNYVFFDGPYLTERDDISFTLSATTGNGITVTASTDFFTADHVNGLLRLKHDTGSDPHWGYGTIVGYTSATQVTMDIIRDFNATTASDAYREGAWSDERGWPRCVGFHEERLYWGGTANNPQSIWGTKTASDLFQDFDPTDEADEVVADSGITITISDGQVDEVLWVESDKNSLVIGTRGGEFSLRASETATTASITQDNLKISRTTSEGCNTVQGQYIGNTLLFIQKAGRKLMEFGYNFESDSTLSKDLTLLAEDITEGATSATSGILEMAFQREPDRILWCVRKDGVLLGFTYNKEQKINAWHTHVMGGTDAVVESITVIPTPDGSRDELWMCTSRTIDGATHRYVEYMEHYDIPVQDDWFYVHSGLTYDSTPTSTITGLEHLEGEVVTILTDGATHPDRTVASGSITLNDSYSVVHIGLQYDTILRTMPIEVQVGDALSLGKKKRIDRIWLGLLDSLGLKIGRDEATLEVVSFRDGSDLMDNAPEVFTGVKEVIFPGEYGDTVFVYIKQDQPLPTFLISLSVSIVSGDV